MRSATGELTWDFGKGVVTLNSPRTQGAVGFLSKAGRVELKDVVIGSANDFGAVIVTSLDEKPLASSRRALSQAMTEEKHFGWKVEDGKGLVGWSAEGLGTDKYLVPVGWAK